MSSHHQLTVISAITAMCLLRSAVSYQILNVLRTPCLNLSGAAWISAQPAYSLGGCYWASRQAISSLQSVGFAQFDSHYQSCAVYRYRDVCKMMNMTSLGLVALGIQQSAMVVPGCDGLMQDLKYDVLTANAYFSAVWVGGYGPALENLVCGQSGPRNPVLASGVSWTSDGAQTDGVTSRLMVNDSIGLNFSLGYTVALELKRQPRSQTFLELFSCSDFSVNLDHLVENPVGDLYTYNNLVIMQGTTHLLTKDPNEFFKIVLAFNRTANVETHFYNSASVPSSAFNPTVYASGGAAYAYKPICLKIGYGHTGTTNGTIRMAAIANNYLPEDVVVRFLAGK